MKTDPNADPIVEEIHRTRRAIYDRFAGDAAAISEDAERRRRAEGRPEWTDGPSPSDPDPDPATPPTGGPQAYVA